MSALGIDIGGSSVKAALIEHGKTLALGQSRRYDDAGQYTRGPSCDELRRAILEAVEQVGAPGGAATIGVCAPGVVDECGVVQASVNIPALVGMAIKDLLPRGLTDVRLTTDALAAATDILHIESAAGPGLRGRLLAVSLGTGIGAAVLDEGRPLRISVQGESPGHIGHIDVTLPENELSGSAPRAADGASGTAEAYLGLRALIARHGSNVETSLSHLLSVAPGGRLQPPVRALVKLLRICHAIYRPDHIRLLGGVGLALRPLGPALRAAVAHELTTLARPNWTLGFAVDAHHAARGAAMLAACGSGPGPVTQRA